MVARLRERGVRVMVSIWPTVSRLATTWNEMWRAGYIVRNMRGAAGQMYFVDNGDEDGLYLHYYDCDAPGRAGLHLGTRAGGLLPARDRRLLARRLRAGDDPHGT